MEDLDEVLEELEDPRTGNAKRHGLAIRMMGLIKKMSERTGKVPTTTTSTSVAAALRALGAKKVSISMPYPEEVAKAASNSWKPAGVESTGCEWLGRCGFQMAEVTPETLYHLSKEVDRPESQAIFISCTGLHTFDIIEKLERDLKEAGDHK